jgi:hypothetical protein
VNSPRPGGTLDRRGFLPRVVDPTTHRPG